MSEILSQDEIDALLTAVHRGDIPIGQEIGGRNLAGQDDRMVDRNADDASEKANPLGPLRRGDVEPQRKRRAGDLVLPEALCDRVEVIAKLVGQGDLLQDLVIGLSLGLFGVRKLGE